MESPRKALVPAPKVKPGSSSPRCPQFLSAHIRRPMIYSIARAASDRWADPYSNSTRAVPALELRRLREKSSVPRRYTKGEEGGFKVLSWGGKGGRGEGEGRLPGAGRSVYLPETRRRTGRRGERLGHWARPAEAGAFGFTGAMDFSPIPGKDFVPVSRLAEPSDYRSGGPRRFTSFVPRDDLYPSCLQISRSPRDKSAPIVARQPSDPRSNRSTYRLKLLLSVTATSSKAAGSRHRERGAPIRASIRAGTRGGRRAGPTEGGRIRGSADRQSSRVQPDDRAEGNRVERTPAPTGSPPPRSLSDRRNARRRTGRDRTGQDRTNGPERAGTGPGPGLWRWWYHHSRPLRGAAAAAAPEKKSPEARSIIVASSCCSAAPAVALRDEERRGEERSRRGRGALVGAGKKKGGAGNARMLAA
ncbi:hypothetical protein MPTK1_6g09970 [Marchantia polymorpha subsp. ruderalis]|uniref:Uncharacterized protein n=2 Tax=Marchantia polymorpha TaxID=3197 RepID=A0AAF6BQF3_MARPO|nr:hypothetical protein MARPO_0016s0040 [Marchantia polymorpha]BBN14237.1 hypothetical protein Mp_6g09970 [Marchantia polymorpha subsp. ruderalis]|eukprot:PTQ44972.1 hypothetical protein MARPO_0016s0040 [Marchantia polymorpha]